MDTDHRQTFLGLNQDKELERLISDVMNHTVSPNSLAESRELVQLGNALECLEDTLRSTSRTAKLWLRFMDYIEIIKDFICCERLGMWDGHLNAVTALLNLFAATGHIHYAKSARLYVQEMRKLPSTHPWLHQKFVEGYHTVRRSEIIFALCTNPPLHRHDQWLPRCRSNIGIRNIIVGSFLLVLNSMALYAIWNMLCNLITE